MWCDAEDDNDHEDKLMLENKYVNDVEIGDQIMHDCDLVRTYFFFGIIIVIFLYGINESGKEVT
jgi:hypothetical protein